MFINFSDLPGHTNLFLDYLYEFENVSRFYNSNFRRKDLYPRLFDSVIKHYKQNRNYISTIIREQYIGKTLSESTSRNIDLLKERNTLTIITGQQVGIGTGPLYTLYKILTIVKLAKQLNDDFDNFNFVPIFWLAADDHDFEEISTVSIINKENKLVKIKYTDGFPEDAVRNSMANTPITDSIKEFIEKIALELRDTEFKKPLLEKLEAAYRPGASIKNAFRDFAFSLFDHLGIILFDPTDVKFKELLKPIFTKEINEYRTHTEKLISISAQLEEVYHTQVKVRPINLFMTYENGRHLIEPTDDNDYRLKRKRVRFSKQELLNLIEKSPEIFSANVLLRPITQDFLFPNAAYIGGPGELSYFAQVSALYHFFDVPTPLIYPRSSVTILEKYVATVLEKYSIKLLEVYVNSEGAKEKVLSTVSDVDLSKNYYETRERILTALEMYRSLVSDVDRTIGDSGLRTKQKIEGLLDEYFAKSNEALHKKYDVILKQFEKVSTNLYPDSVLQEREYSILYFLNKYGDSFITKVYGELTINQFEHQIITL